MHVNTFYTRHTGTVAFNITIHVFLDRVISCFFNKHMSNLVSGG